MKKKFVLLSALFAVFTSAAVAADKAGDPCQTTGRLTSQIGGEILSCIDGKWKHTGQVGTTQVTIRIQLLEWDKLLTSAQVTTLDGQPVQVGLGSERSYIAEAKKEGDKVVLIPGTVEDGFFMMLTPTLTQDGKIGVEFSVRKSEVTFKQGDLEVQLPQVSAVELKQKVTLDNGKETVIPFGPLVMPMKAVETGKPPRAQYTLKLVAAKI